MSRTEEASEERGAAMLETAMVIVAFFILLGAVFDLGVALYQYSMLRHTTNLAARDISVQLSSENFSSYSLVDACAHRDDVMRDYLDHTAATLLGHGGTNMIPNWKACVRGVPGIQLRSLQVSSQIPVRCFFLCRFFGNNWRLSANSAVTIDTASVPNCPSPGINCS